jgi:hypothetical protein
MARVYQVKNQSKQDTQSENQIKPQAVTSKPSAQDENQSIWSNEERNATVQSAF